MTGTQPSRGCVCSCSFDHDTPRLSSTLCRTVAVLQSSGCASASVGRIANSLQELEQLALRTLCRSLCVGERVQRISHLDPRLWFERVHVSGDVQVELVTFDLCQVDDSGMLEKLVRIRV